MPLRALTDLDRAGGVEQYVSFQVTPVHMPTADAEQMAQIIETIINSCLEKAACHVTAMVRVPEEQTSRFLTPADA